MSTENEATSTLIFLCLFIIYAGTSIFSFTRIIKLRKFERKWRKTQIFYILVLLQAILRSVCLLILASKQENLTATGMYLLIATPDSLFLMSYIILVWQLVSIYYFAHIENHSNEEFIASLSKKFKTSKLSVFIVLCICGFGISQFLLYSLLIIGDISRDVVSLQLDWLNIGLPAINIALFITLAILYSGVPLKSLSWKRKLRHFFLVSIYWTVSRLFRGLSSIVGRVSDNTLILDLENDVQSTGDYIMLILVLVLSEICCIFSVQDYGFMGIFMLSEEESEITAPIVNKTEDTSEVSIQNISLYSDNPIISLSEIEHDEEHISRKHGLGKLYKSKFKNTEVLFRKINLPRLSGYIVEDLDLEIREQRSLNIPRVVPIIGIVIELPIIGFVTPIMTKGSLYNSLHIQPIKLNITEKIKLAYHISSSILSFHSTGKVHGHLTSHNILFDSELNPFISDLGFHKLKKYAGIMSGYTNIGPWSSPELLSDKRSTPIKAQPSDDSYSFGMVLWEILAEQEPFPGYSRKQLINNICEIGNRPVIPSNTPEDVAELIIKCWNPDSNQRPDFSFISNVLGTYNSL
jgi:tRNA A-37 threonylcarbamoyl transferase component Bud32